MNNLLSLCKHPNKYDCQFACGAQYWIYGHSHRNIDKRIGNTQFVSNQLGYVFSGEHASFRPAAFFEI